VRNLSFSGGAEAWNVRRKTDLAFWLDFLLLFDQAKRRLKDD
jgi:hypothetical protein